MPNKVKAHDEARKKRLNKISRVMPANLQRARKYRSSGNWQKVRGMKLREDPLCCDPWAWHKEEGGDVLASQVHHVKELSKFFDIRAYGPNLRSICVRCHDAVSKIERQNKDTTWLFKKV